MVTYVILGTNKSPDPPSSKHPNPSAPPHPPPPSHPTMPQMSPIRNPQQRESQLQPPPPASAPPHPSQQVMPQMTPIRNPNLAEQQSSSPMTPTKPGNMRQVHPAPPIGKPPPHIHSQAPPIAPQPQHAFGKLVVTIVRGLNLKAGQGVFGRADPYVKLRLGDNEVSTNPHKNGGKNPVRFV